MIFSLFNLHAVLGLILIAAGIIFDFALVTRSFTEAFKDNPVAYINSWKKYVFELVKFYLIVLGFLNIAFALLVSSGDNMFMTWIIFGLIASGSVLMVIGGYWEGYMGPVFKMEPPCYVMGTGLAAIFLSIVLKIYVIWW